MSPRVNSSARSLALYSRRSTLYAKLIRYVGYQNGIESVFRTEMAHALSPCARVLDAGCGAGAVTFALLSAYGKLSVPRGIIDAFDLTPKMLQRFRGQLDRERACSVRLVQADVLNLESSLPADWTDYDLVVSSGMLEYVGRRQLSQALVNLRGLLKPRGSLLLFVSRKGLFNKWAMERWWQANCYDAAELELALRSAGFESVSFHRFPAPYAFLNAWGFAVEAR